jgi:predicted transcriptional regulator
MTQFTESIDRLFAAMKANNKTGEIANNIGVSPQYVTSIFRTIIKTEKRAEALSEREKQVINAAKDILADQLETARKFENSLAQVTA